MRRKLIVTATLLTCCLFVVAGIATAHNDNSVSQSKSDINDRLDRENLRSAMEGFVLREDAKDMQGNCNHQVFDAIRRQHMPFW